MKYPRPQMVRKQWQSLDGIWKVNGAEATVPSCQSAESLVYEKTFDFKKESDRVLLHIGAADQIAEVYLNDTYLGKHIGGYLPFSFEITDCVKARDNYLKIVVTDHLDHTYPYGKQRTDRGGMWYTPASGIWKSVWMEQVPERYIEDIKITPDLKGVSLEIHVNDRGTQSTRQERIDVKDPILWSPKQPHLYEETIREGKDEVRIYYALRTIDIRTINGISRVCLNGKPIFLHGVLDQGYFHPGLMTAPCEDSYEKDVALVKSLGLNTIRKHIKIEPEEFYYQCDKQGILVVQDMVNSGDYQFFRDTVLGNISFPILDRKKPDERMRFFEKHAEDTIRELYNHPSIVAYTIFNEGWGQFNSDEMYRKLKQLDGSRLYDSTSGWFRQKNNDFDSLHIYRRLIKLRPKTRPLFVSECGGYSLNLDETKETYGYGKCENKDELMNRIEKLYERMILPGIPKGCCGCIYTQISDIEDEINGLMTYDRKEVKVIPERMKAISEKIEKAIGEVGR